MKRQTLLISSISVLVTVLLVIGGLQLIPRVSADTKPATQANLNKPAAADAVNIIKAANDLPAPITRTAPETVQLHLTTKEVNGYLDNGVTYTYWTFDGTVPGPLLRVKVGDTVEVTLTNDASSGSPHSIDLHAVTGPGGGAVATQVAPGETKHFTFKAMNPGVYVYHCASPHIPTHVANGMYGLIVVEPEGGLQPVDKEFYVMQGEIYTSQAKGTKGHVTMSSQNMRDEHPTYVVFNGANAALTEDNAMHVKVGDKVRLFVGNGGPNLISSFHVIGEIFDTVHQEGATEGVSNIQTTLIQAGGAAWVEFT
ncbi:MAG TPA: multicopper oxidase domain-containing protein, partial [Roseiflexaceae bacterium]|nr:multicopper oxidase domain-containing protein [Roseiflexaceae bacterium]